MEMRKMKQNSKNVSNEIKDSYVTNKITITLLELLQKKRLKDISISYLCDKAEVGRASFYRNFKSKDEIVKHYIDEITNNFIKNKKVNYSPNNFKEYLIILFTHLKENEDIGLLLYKADLIHIIKDEFDKIFYSKANSTKEEYNYYFISGGLYNIYYYWLINGAKETPLELANMFMDFYILKGNTAK